MEEKRLGENLYVKYNADLRCKIIILYSIRSKEVIIEFDNGYTITYEEESSWYTAYIENEIEYNGNCFLNLLKEVCEGLLALFKVERIHITGATIIEVKNNERNNEQLYQQDLLEDFKQDDIKYIFNEEELEYIATYLQYKYSIKRL